MFSGTERLTASYEVYMTGVKAQAGGFLFHREAKLHTNINTLPVLLQLVVQRVFAAGQETGHCDRCRIKAHSR